MPGPIQRPVEPLAIGTIGFGDVRLWTDGFQQFAEMTTPVSRRICGRPRRLIARSSGGRWRTRNNGVLAPRETKWPAGVGDVEVPMLVPRSRFSGPFTIQVDGGRSRPSSRLPHDAPRWEPPGPEGRRTQERRSPRYSRGREAAALSGRARPCPHGRASGHVVVRGAPSVVRAAMAVRMAVIVATASMSRNGLGRFPRRCWGPRPASSGPEGGG